MPGHQQGGRPPRQLLKNHAVLGVATGDFDADGHVDLAAIVEQRVFDWHLLVLPGKGGGRFGRARKAPVPADFFPASSVAVTDFDLDGAPDLVLFVDSSHLGILLGRGDGTFRRPLRYASSGAGGLTLADLNSDFQPDILVANGESAVAVFHNNSNERGLHGYGYTR